GRAGARGDRAAWARGRWWGRSAGRGRPACRGGGGMGSMGGMVTAVELAVQDVAGVRIAQAVGVDRIELCTGLSLGGLTPSVALVERAVAAGVGVHVLVRPRAGGFD